MKIIVNEEQFNIILKNIKEEKTLISEGLTDIVYHFTNVNELNNILTNNKFTTEAAFGTDSDYYYNKKYLYFFSTTRAKRTGYTFGSVKLKLDGRKLGQRYKSTSLEYWSTPEESARHKKAEHEDRILTNSYEIPNALNYILAIHVNKTKINENILNNILRITKENNIPIYFYEDRNDFLGEKTKNSTKPTKTPNESTNTKSQINEYYFPLAALAAYKNENNHRKLVTFLNNQEIIDKFNNFLNNKFIYNLEVDINWSLRFDDLIRRFKSDVHNSRMSDDSFLSFVVKLIADEMRKLKVRTIKDYVEAKYWIGKKKQEYFNQIIFNNISKKIDEELKSIIEREKNIYDYIEIEGEYYDKFIESSEILNILNKAILILKFYLKKEILENKDMFSQIYKLGPWVLRDYIKESQVFDEFDKLNITDSRYEKDNYKEKIKDIVLYNVIDSINAKEEVENAMKEYKSQFEL